MKLYLVKIRGFNLKCKPEQKKVIAPNERAAILEVLHSKGEACDEYHGGMEIFAEETDEAMIL